MQQIGRRALLTAAGASCVAGSPKPVAKVGEPAPPFSILDFQFKRIAFEAMRGKVVMLNYWATWCAPCRTELPLLDTYYRRHADEGLLIFAVKSVNDQHSNHDLQPLAKVVSFPLAWGLSGKGYGEIGDSLPTNYVIDRAGVLRYARAGAFDLASLEYVVTPLLKEPVPAAAAAT